MVRFKSTLDVRLQFPWNIVDQVAETGDLFFFWKGIMDIVFSKNSGIRYTYLFLEVENDDQRLDFTSLYPKNSDIEMFQQKVDSLGKLDKLGGQSAGASWIVASAAFTASVALPMHCSIYAWRKPTMARGHEK